MKGLRKRDGYYTSRRVVQSYIWLSISLIIQRNHKRFKWNLVGWLETCEERLSGTCFTFDFHLCQKLIIICPVIFQKTESPQLALGGTDIGSGNQCTSPGPLERQSERVNSVENGEGPLMAVLGFLPCLQGSSSCPHLHADQYPPALLLEGKRTLQLLLHLEPPSFAEHKFQNGADTGFGARKSQSGDQTTIYYEEFT